MVNRQKGTGPPSDGSIEEIRIERVSWVILRRLIELQGRDRLGHRRLSGGYRGVFGRYASLEGGHKFSIILLIGNPSKYFSKKNVIILARGVLLT